MLEVEPLKPSQYRQVAEWEFGPQPENTDWARYGCDMDKPDWAHFAVYDGVDFVGCISLEKISYNMAAFHVVTARKRVHRQALADVCIGIAGFLFRQGYTAVVANNPINKRAGALLALRCGMREIGHSLTTRYFIITESRYAKNGWYDR